MVKTGWFPPGQSDEDRTRQIFVAVTGLQAFKPADEIEGMLAAQAMAAHHASMECSRRAMLPDQPFEAAQGFRKAAANASRTFIELLSALDRKRGKGGQQVVRVEHVHVHSGGKAIVGTVAQRPRRRGRGCSRNSRRTPCTPARLAHDLPLAQSCPRCGARTRSGRPCRSPAMPNGRCRMHGGSSTGPNGGRDGADTAGADDTRRAQRRDDRAAPGDGHAEASGAEDDCGGVVRRVRRHKRTVAAPQSQRTHEFRAGLCPTFDLDRTSWRARSGRSSVGRAIHR